MKKTRNTYDNLSRSLPYLVLTKMPQHKSRWTRPRCHSLPLKNLFPHYIHPGDALTKLIILDPDFVLQKFEKLLFDNTHALRIQFQRQHPPTPPLLTPIN